MRPARWRTAVSSSVAASGTRTKCTARRACQAPSAIVQPAMWNSGNMHTTPPPPADVVAPTNVRSQLVRCESTTPLGRPVLPLVKKMTCGSRSSTPQSPTGPSGSPDRRGVEPGRERHAQRRRELGARVGVRRAGQHERRLGVLADRSDLGRATSGRSGARTRRRAWRAPRTRAPPRARCRPTTAPGRPVPRPGRRAARAIRLAAASISPNVSARSSSVAASASGVTTAALRRISLTRSIGRASRGARSGRPPTCLSTIVVSRVLVS